MPKTGRRKSTKKIIVELFVIKTHAGKVIIWLE